MRLPKILVLIIKALAAGILPLQVGTVGKPLRVALIGPMAHARREMAGDYWRCLCPAANGSHGVCDTWGRSDNITAQCVPSKDAKYGGSVNKIQQITRFTKIVYYLYFNH